jgi:leader peptidase (prepilin peptidase) / N-methyltransferase
MALSAQIALALPAILAACFGLAFGSFLNVLRTRWPLAQSLVSPPSHCPACHHTLAWWENIPLISYILLRARCRSCRALISPLYPTLEALTGVLFLALWLRFGAPLVTADLTSPGLPDLTAAVSPSLWLAVSLAGYALLVLILVALAALDFEHLWLPDALTLPGIALGFLFNLLRNRAAAPPNQPIAWLPTLYSQLLSILAPAAIVLLIRLLYWLIRRREGMGLGDAKLLALLGAWLGIVPAVESFVLGIFLTALAALALILTAALRGQRQSWAAVPLPLGTAMALVGLQEIWTQASLTTWWLTR